MIELIEGVPGSGKSYYVVESRFLDWVRRNRRLYVYVDGIYLDKLAHFEGRPLPELEAQITVWRTPEEVMANLPHVEVGSAVIIDEAQTIFRSMQRVDPGLLRWLETHRHYGVDVVMMCQSYLQMSSGVTRLVESTTKFRKLGFLGLWSKTQGAVRGNPEDTEIIRKFLVTFKANVYAYYQSYAAAAVREARRMNTVWMSPKVLVGGVAAVFALCVMIWRPWSSLAVNPAPPPATKAQPAAIPARANLLGGPLAPPSAQGIEGPAPVTRPRIRIEGVAVWTDGDGRIAKYVLADGQILTAAQIGGHYGITVTEIFQDGVPMLIGEGVTYGPGSE